MPSVVRFVVRSVVRSVVPCACLAALLVAPSAHAATTTIDYRFTSESTSAGRPPRSGDHRVTSEIDGPHFRNADARGQVEVSSDDGLTTSFGREGTTPQAPLLPEIPTPKDPIAATLDDETLVVGDARPGPTMFGLPTRVYTVDYRYTIVARIAYVITTRTRNHERYDVTVADVDVSSAALRVAFSRGHGHAIARHPEAFTGLPLAIDGTLETGDPATIVTHVTVRAESLRR